MLDDPDGVWVGGLRGIRMPAAALLGMMPKRPKRHR